MDKGDSTHTRTISETIMATLSLSTVSSLRSISTPKSNLFVPGQSSVQWRTARRRSDGVPITSVRRFIATEKPNGLRGSTRLRSAEEETLAPEQEDEPEAVSVPVSPSEALTMFLQADGSMSEAAIPAATSALEGIEGVSNLKVRVVEGITTVELEKQTTVHATGVASSLVESLLGSGFKLQTLQLSFEDQENVVV